MFLSGNRTANGGSPRLPALRRPLGLLLQGALICALALLLSKVAIQRLQPLACQAVGASAVLGMGSAAANVTPGSGVGGVGPLHPCCTWNPYLLSLEAQRWAIDAARMEVPSLVETYRRQLSVQLALGALEQRVPGDFVETGAYRGGMAVLLLKALTVFDPEASRRLWAADSFLGLPEAVDQDAGQGGAGWMAASRREFDDTVAAAEAREGLTRVGDRLRVLQGWFNETLPAAPIQRVALLRMDGDLYTSSRDTLAALYDKVSPGGLIYVDDYGSFQGCRTAVDEFRAQRRVPCPLLRAAEPEEGLGTVGGEAAWEAAWWMKPTC